MCDAIIDTINHIDINDFNLPAGERAANHIALAIQPGEATTHCKRTGWRLKYHLGDVSVEPSITQYTASSTRFSVTVKTAD
jgi:hypothetical protein